MKEEKISEGDIKSCQKVGKESSKDERIQGSINEGINEEREEKCVIAGRKVMYRKGRQARKNTAGGKKDGRKKEG